MRMVIRALKQAVSQRGPTKCCKGVRKCARNDARLRKFTENMYMFLTVCLATAVIAPIVCGAFGVFRQGMVESGGNFNISISA